MKDKRVILGVTAGIAAYKAALLTRLLVKAGAHVRVIMTPAAKNFVTPLTFSTLSKKEVLCEFSNTEGTWLNHVDIANNANLILIAPASANTIAKLANGLCDNLLLAVCLSASCPIYIAPAMDREMFNHPATKVNLKKLSEYNVTIIPSETGELASGLYGEGRMAEPEHIMAFIEKKKDRLPPNAIADEEDDDDDEMEDFSGWNPPNIDDSSSKKNKNSYLPLKGKKALVSTGPTHEAIDPVRFIGNRSSGKMGFAIADELAQQGARVTLVHGPIELQDYWKQDAIKYISVISAGEMYAACIKKFAHADIIVMAAAVADYTPVASSLNKIKKTAGEFALQLKPTKDILLEMGKRKKKNQTLMGFALETEHEKENALQKLKNKNLDAIVLNSMKDTGAGPGGDTNKITILGLHTKPAVFELKRKTEVAKDIVDYIIKKCLKK